MLLINLAEHTEAVFVLNEPDLLCEDLSMQKEDATVVIAGTDQSLVKTKKDRRDQWFFFHTSLQDLLNNSGLCYLSLV